jgi:isopenicillin N synthase-like dioxygenase
MAEVQGIPLVDFAAYDAGASARAELVAATGAALERFGFVAVTGHGVPDALFDEAYAAAAELFALPEAEKRACERPQSARQRGYTPFLQEKAKDQAAGDLKEFWHIGRDLPAEHPYVQNGWLPENVFPESLPHFAEVMRRLFVAQAQVAERLLEIIALHLGVPPAYFADVANLGNHVLRVINYPDVAVGPEGSVRAAAHEDINLLTVLPSATRPGLELLDRDGRWVAIQATPGVFICDTGDMMQVLSKGRLPSVTHRVVNPPNSDGGRLSMPFFMHPRPDAHLTPYGDAEPGPLSRQFLMDRLIANGVAG